MQLIEKNLGSYPVKAIIISHSHADHFGGIAGVISAEDKADESLSLEEQLASGKVPVIVPEGFTKNSIQENVYAGKGMGRRANYQYGVLLDPRRDWQAGAGHRHGSVHRHCVVHDSHL